MLWIRVFRAEPGQDAGPMRKVMNQGVDRMMLPPTSIQRTIFWGAKQAAGQGRIGERGALPSLSRPDANEHAFLESRRLHLADRVAQKVHRDCRDLFMLGNTSWR